MSDNKSPIEQKIAGNWKEFSGRLKESWGILTDDDLDVYEGRMDKLEGYIEKKTGESRRAIREKIDAIAGMAKEKV